LHAALERWRTAIDSVGAGHEALRSAAILYQQHGPLLRALAHAATQDRDLARVWHGAIDQVVSVAEQQIEATNRTGRYRRSKSDPQLAPS
jgi:hypothetical protein